MYITVDLSSSYSFQKKIDYFLRTVKFTEKWAESTERSCMLSPSTYSSPFSNFLH